MRARLIFILLLSAGVALSLFFARALWRTDVLRSAEREGFQIAERLIATRVHFATVAAAKAVRGGLQIRMDHRSGRSALPFPATFTHELANIYSAPSNIAVLFYSPFPFDGRPAHVFDPFQVSAWNSLIQGLSARVVELDDGGRNTILRVVHPDRMTHNSCVDCHNGHPRSTKRDWKRGDLRGVVEVALDVDDRLSGVDRALFSIAMGAIALIVGAGFAADRMQSRIGEGSAAWQKGGKKGPPAPVDNKPEPASFALMPPPSDPPPDDGKPGPPDAKTPEPPKPPRA